MKVGDLICQKGHPDYKGVIVELDPVQMCDRKGKFVRVCWYDEWIVSIWEVADIERPAQSEEK